MRLTGSRVIAIWIGGTIAEFILIDWIATAAGRSESPAVPGFSSG